MTDADKVMNPRHFVRDPADTRIRISSVIQIGIPDHFWSKYWRWQRFALYEHRRVAECCSHDAFGAAWTANFDSATTATTTSAATYDSLTTEPSTSKPPVTGSTDIYPLLNTTNRRALFGTASCCSVCGSMCVSTTACLDHVTL